MAPEVMDVSIARHPNYASQVVVSLKSKDGAVQVVCWVKTEQLLEEVRPLK